APTSLRPASQWQRVAWIEEQKEPPLAGRPKSREETPKEGCNTEQHVRCCTAQVMLHCTTAEEGRWSQGRWCSDGCRSEPSRHCPGHSAILVSSVSARSRGPPTRKTPPKGGP